MGEPRKSEVQHASRPAAVQLVTGNAGDHQLVYSLLRAANQAPSYEQFQASLDEPSYEPVNRLLVKRDGQLVAQVQLLDRAAWFHGVKLPVGGVENLVTLPEFRDANHDQLLLSAAEQSLRGRQAVLAFAYTNRPGVFGAAGWSTAIGQRHTVANVNDILSRIAQSLPAQGFRQHRPLRIRLWRQIELEALRHVYHRASTATWGAFDRSEAYWRWLVGRREHDELIVAICGRDNLDVLESPAHIVGYAIVRGAQIIELSTLPAYQRATVPLLARACQDAIERNHRALSLHLPITDPLHELLLSAGGSWATGDRTSGTLMFKLLAPPRWIEGMQHVLVERANAAGLSLPLVVTIDAGRRKYRLEVAHHGCRLVRDDSPAADVVCSMEKLSALLLGNIDLTTAQPADDLTIYADHLAASLSALFPAVPLWQSKFDAHCR